MRRTALVLALAVALVACTPDGDSLNEADVEFLQGMIPHHGQAVAMAEMVEVATTRPELRELAQGIIATQTEEITVMTDLLEQSGEDPPSADMAGSDHGGMQMMAGMMSDADMAAMQTMTGVDFDLMFAESMIVHHQGAIDAAEVVLLEGRHPAVRELAQAVIEAQTAEIDQLESWVEAWA
jgi:uncharacterized protein (DUF305 family)